MNRDELMALPADELCRLYREQVARLYGKERAAASRVFYDRGWFYIVIASRYPDGSIGLGGRLPVGQRKRQVVERILNLATREPETGE